MRFDSIQPFNYAHLGHVISETIRVSLIEDIEAETVVSARRCNADFRASARLDDLLEVRTRILSLGGASIEAEQMVWHGQDSLVRAEVKLGCIDRNGRPVRLPEEVHAALARFKPRDGRS